MLAGLELGIAGSAAWGAADFCGKKSAEKIGFRSALFGVNAIGAVALGAALWLGWVAPPGSDWPRWTLLGALNAVAGLFFYFALQYGRLSLVSPITAAYPVIAVALAYAASGERLSPLLAAAVIAVIGGSMLAAAGSSAGPAPRTPGAGGERRALVAASAGALLFGIVFFGLGREAGGSPAAPVFVLRLTGAVLLAAPFLAERTSAFARLRNGWLWGAGLLDSGAYLLYIASLRSLPTSIAAPIGGLFPIWSLLLARVFLRERLNPRQWAGIGLILAAIGVLARR